jgi:DNA mismatch endonuclease, patch repair protein
MKVAGGVSWQPCRWNTPMPDVFTKAKRSAVMSRIRGRGNKDTELALMKIFRQHGITGWRRNQKIFGKPDFLFRHQRLALFVDGCFWHGCPRHCKIPTGNRAFWKKKFATNKARDRRVNRELRKLGWQVVRVWEHDLALPINSRLSRILVELKSNEAN